MEKEKTLSEKAIGEPYEWLKVKDVKEAVDGALFDIANNCSEKRMIIGLSKIVHIFKRRFGEFK